jgi:hypothetical protein
MLTIFHKKLYHKTDKKGSPLPWHSQLPLKCYDICYMSAKLIEKTNNI